MKAILIVFFLFVAYLNAASIDRCANFSLEKELETINNTCLTLKDKQIVTGNVVRGFLAALLYGYSVPVAQETIGLSEMRKALGFKKMGAWTYYKFMGPSEEEIENAKEIEKYYELKEPRDMMRSLNSFFLLEKNVISTIDSFDERIPSIRTIYRCEFAEIMKRVGKINRETVDKMIEKWTEISSEIKVAIDVFQSHGDCGREEMMQEMQLMAQSSNTKEEQLPKEI